MISALSDVLHNSAYMIKRYVSSPNQSNQHLEEKSITAPVVEEIPPSPSTVGEKDPVSNNPTLDRESNLASDELSFENWK